MTSRSERPLDADPAAAAQCATISATNRFAVLYRVAGGASVTADRYICRGDDHLVEALAYTGQNAPGGRAGSRNTC